MAFKWTASSWRTYSEKGKSWRSSEFNAIEKAIGRYNPSEISTKVRLQRLLDILVAIAKWWSWKQEKKFDYVNSKTDSTGRKYAASEETLKPNMGNADFSARLDAVKELLKDVVEEIDDVMAKDRAAWGNEYFTDPAKPVDQFMYLVTAQTETPLAKGGDPEYRIAAVKNPDLIEKALISASVIKKGDVKLWGPAGFILSAPKQCIGAAANDDLAIANAAALHHAMEKYIEMLRAYLRAEGGNGLAGPAQLAPKLNHHTEVVVLGRSYDRITTVTGIYVLADPDQKDKSGAEVKPGNCFRQISQFAKGTTVKYVVEPLPLVTDKRMQMYRDLNEERDLPIVPIPIEKDTEVNLTYFQSVYDGTIMIQFNDKQMVLHGSKEHLTLEAEAKAGTQKKLMKFDNHKGCKDCGVI